MAVRVYQEYVLIKDQYVELESNAAAHVAKVLRMRVGEPLILFDGHNQEFTSEISKISKSQVQVKILAHKQLSRESPLKIHLAQGLSKGERMDWVMQKAVELGVTQITPIISQHNVVKLPTERVAKKLEHWRHIAISACEQCGRNQIPEIHEPVKFSEILQFSAITKIILHPSAQTTWQSLAAPTNGVLLLIGPEGGFAQTEVTTALEHNFHALTLGPRILRTETAAIAALTALQLKWGDLG